MDLEFRLIVQSRSHHPWGVYSGTTNCYSLETRKPGEQWQAVPVVFFEDLPPEDQARYRPPTDHAASFHRPLVDPPLSGASGLELIPPQGKSEPR